MMNTGRYNHQPQLQHHPHSQPQPQPHFIIMHDYDLIEGITASLLFPLFIYIFKNLEGFSLYYATMFSWFITWFFRKLSVNAYLFFRETQTHTLKKYI